LNSILEVEIKALVALFAGWPSVGASKAVVPQKVQLVAALGGIEMTGVEFVMAER